MLNSTHRVLTRATVVAALAAGLVAASAGAAMAAPASPATPATPATEGSTGITMTVYNQTDNPLTLVSAQNPFGHWQNRATSIPPNSSIVVSDYSDNVSGANIAPTYSAPNGTTTPTSIELNPVACVYYPAAAQWGYTGPGYDVASTVTGHFHTQDTYTITAA